AQKDAQVNTNNKFDSLKNQKVESQHSPNNNETHKETTHEEEPSKTGSTNKKEAESKERRQEEKGKEGTNDIIVWDPDQEGTTAKWDNKPEQHAKSKERFLTSLSCKETNFAKEDDDTPHHVAEGLEAEMQYHGGSLWSFERFQLGNL
ncbi:hypothetical protein HAX54_016654, partial [Datura stramonium]|nr:hypothetical protein [Datura stramonium]